MRTHTHTHKDIRRHTTHFSSLSSAQSIISSCSSCESSLWARTPNDPTCHLYMFWTLAKHAMSGQWEYLLSHMAIIQSQTVLSIFFFFYLMMLQQWNPISNLSPLHQTLSHPLCSLMHTLKRTGGPKVGFGPGVGGVCGSQRGIYSPP